MAGLAAKTAATLGAALTAACSVVGVRNAPEPPHAVVERLSGDVEVRRYAPRVAAETRLEEPDANRAFRTLFDYISGANAGGEEIAMTTPVAASAGEDIAMTAPVAVSREEGYAMRFFLPESYTARTAPRPTDPAVTIREVPEETVAALAFSGLGSDRAVAEQRRRLLERVAASDWRVAGPSQSWFYDPPWTLPPFRRNEVVVPVARE